MARENSLHTLHELERSNWLVKLFSVVNILNCYIKCVLHQPGIREQVLLGNLVGECGSNRCDSPERPAT